MADQEDAKFERNASHLFEALEASTRELKDPDFFAAVIEKGIADAKALLKAERIAEAEQKYAETKIALQRAKDASATSPLCSIKPARPAVLLLDQPDVPTSNPGTTTLPLMADIPPVPATMPPPDGEHPTVSYSPRRSRSRFSPASCPSGAVLPRSQGVRADYF